MMTRTCRGDTGGAPFSVLVHRLARGITVRAVLRGALRGICAGALAAGFLVLPLRHGLRLPRGRLLPVASLPFVAAAAAAAHAFRKHRFPVTAARTLLDARGHCGGLLMTEGAPGWDAWRSEVRLPDSLQPHWREPRLWQAAAGALVFAAATAAWPLRPEGPHAGGRLDMGGDLDRLRAQIEELAEDLAGDETADDWLARIEELEASARSDAPAAAWDTLDSMSDRLREQASAAAEAALADMRRLDLLAAIAESLRESALEGTLSRNAAAREALASALDHGPGASDFTAEADLWETLREAGADAAFADPAWLEALAGHLRAELAAHAARIEHWQELRLIEADWLAQTSGSVGAEDALAAWLAGDCDGTGADALLALAGIGRGPGPVPLLIGEAIREDGASYVEARLPPAAGIDPDASRAIGLSAVAPDPEPAEAVAAGALGGADAGGGAARRRPLLPRHRRTVSAFFDRPPEGLAP